MIWIDKLGAWSIGYFVIFGNLAELAYQSARATFDNFHQSRLHLGKETLKQIYFSGVEALFSIVTLGFAMGLFAGFYSSPELGAFVDGRALSKIIMQLMISNGGPLVVLLLVIARSCTAIASELGNMKVNREIELLRTLCIHPYSFLVLPRVVGGVIAVFCLGVFYTFALMSAFSLSQNLVHKIGFDVSIRLIMHNWNFGFFVFSFLKYLVSAAFVFLLACQYGFSVAKSSYEVPRVSSKAVLHSVVGVLLILTLLISLQASLSQRGFI